MSKTIEAILLKVNGDTEIVDINALYRPLKELVDGWIECVDAPSLGITFVIDEEGKLKDKPVNYVATIMWSADINNRGGNLTDVLVGNVVIVNIQVDSDGDWKSLTQKQINELLLKIPPLVNVITVQAQKEKEKAHGTQN